MDRPTVEVENTLANLAKRVVEIEKLEALHIQQLADARKALADARVHFAEWKNINQDAVTYALSNEFLAAIFEAGLIDGLIISQIVTISHVSRHWREIALQTPSLWSTIHVNGNTMLLDAYLDRSGACQLDIVVDCDLRYPEPQILYNFDRFVTHVTPWHAWRNFHFVTWLLGVWQGPDFVRCQTEAGYFSNFWLSLRWNMQRHAATEAKFTCLRTKCPNLDQNCRNEVCHIFWPFVRTLRDTVTQPIFRHVRYPPWRMTNELIEIVQYSGKFFISIKFCLILPDLSSSVIHQGDAVGFVVAFPTVVHVSLLSHRPYFRCDSVLEALSRDRSLDGPLWPHLSNITLHGIWRKPASHSSTKTNSHRAAHRFCHIEIFQWNFQTHPRVPSAGCATLGIVIKLSGLHATSIPPCLLLKYTH